MVCPSWERWPDTEQMKSLLNRGCDHVLCENVGYNGQSPNGLMILWKGQKRSRLTGTQWNQVLISETYRRGMLDRIRHHQIKPWGQEILLSSKVGQRVLEIGSGTGEISLQLALAGRRVTVLDISRESLEFTQSCAKELGVTVDAVCGDATQMLSMFGDRQFDCVWSSGLLEHFTSQERQSMLREWARVSCGSVITIVPNASAIGYQTGKSMMEEAGTWEYGQEDPVQTMREEYKAAGLNVVAEYAVGGKWGFDFLPANHPLRNWSETLTEKELRRMNQGYLLITRGVVLR
jgi:ubiquinone/menaquinone biosynthesis C-methylase UbiE